ncbi:MAG: hypothetical protein MJ231_03625 [bacterium]|nr:hypothetical protein [bacterium]
MNLHEECLLKYLLNPTGLVQTLEILKLNNLIIEQELACKTGKHSNIKMRYTPTKI